MADRAHLGEQVVGPTLTLAANVKRLLEADPKATMIDTAYGTFYVEEVKLVYYDGGHAEVLGYLRPDEGDGATFDFYTAAPQAQ